MSLVKRTPPKKNSPMEKFLIKNMQTKNNTPHTNDSRSHSLDRDQSREDEQSYEKNRSRKRQAISSPAKDSYTSMEHFNAFKEEMKTLILGMFSSQETELKMMTEPLRDIQESTHKIEGSVSTLIAQNEEFQKKIQILELQVQEEKKKVILLEDKIEQLEMNNRKSSFVIKNVPFTPGETRDQLLDLVMCLASSVSISINKSVISDIYRVKGKKGSSLNTPIVVELSSVIVKSELLRHCKSFNVKNKEKLCVKHLGIRKNPDTPVYVAEHLTSKGTRLIFLARDLIKSTPYKFCWTAYGKVYVRKDENSPVILIKNEAQIQALINKE